MLKCTNSIIFFYTFQMFYHRKSNNWNRFSGGSIKRDEPEVIIGPPGRTGATGATGQYGDTGETGATGVSGEFDQICLCIYCCGTFYYFGLFTNMMR